MTIPDAFVLIWMVTALLALLEGLFSVGRGVQFLRRCRKNRSAAGRGFHPPAALILPCRGIDPGLKENLTALCRQDYPDFELVFVTSDPADRSVPVIQEVRKQETQMHSRLVFAGEAHGRSQKVHNLLYAVGNLRRSDQVLAFADSDIRVQPDWLRCLVDPLADPGVGISTGFRWYVPQRAGTASKLRSAWNAGTVTVLSGRDSPFAWGGAMAFRREVFDQCAVATRWEHVLSDDYAASRTIHRHGFRIRFEPRCLSFSREDCSWKELWSWTFRQLAITRVYHPALWLAALVSQFVHSLAVWGGLLLWLFAAAGGVPERHLFWVATFPLAIYLLSCLKGWLRLKGVEALFPAARGWLKPCRQAYIFWGPLVSLLTLVGLFRSIFNREIEWRGIRYRMVSRNRTEIIRGG